MVMGLSSWRYTVELVRGPFLVRFFRKFDCSHAQIYERRTFCVSRTFVNDVIAMLLYTDLRKSIVNLRGHVIYEKYQKRAPAEVLIFVCLMREQ